MNNPSKKVNFSLVDHCVEDILEKKSKKGIKVMSICKVLYVSASIVNARGFRTLRY